MKRAISLLALAAAVVPALVAQAPKRRVAVLDFDYATVHEYVLDPMLATGGSAVAAVKALKKAGAARVRFLCLVAAPEGVKAMLAAHSDVPVYAAALDRQLNEHGYILPGLGDAGDRLFGTR